MECVDRLLAIGRKAEDERVDGVVCIRAVTCFGMLDFPFGIAWLTVLALGIHVMVIFILPKNILLTLSCYHILLNDDLKLPRLLLMSTWI